MKSPKINLMFILMILPLIHCKNDSKTIKSVISYQAVDFTKENKEDISYKVKYLTVFMLENTENKPITIHSKSFDDYILVVGNKKYQMLNSDNDSIIINPESFKEVTFQTILKEKYTLSDFPNLEKSLYQSKVINTISNQEVLKSAEYRVVDFDSSPVYYKHEF